jgi:hypothetical protein
MSEDIYSDLKKLADGWCERRALRALHQYLPGYFALSGLADGWHELLDSLKNVLVFAKDEITATEKEEVKRVIIRIEDMLQRRSAGE